MNTTKNRQWNTMSGLRLNGKYFAWSHSGKHRKQVTKSVSVHERTTSVRSRAVVIPEPSFGLGEVMSRWSKMVVGKTMGEGVVKRDMRGLCIVFIVIAVALPVLGQDEQG